MVTLSDPLGGYRSEAAIKYPVRAATTAALSTLSGYQTVDGVTFASTDADNGYNRRILVKDQTDASTNGIYLVSSGTWARVFDMDGDGDIVSGTLVYVSGGSANYGKTFVLTTADSLTIGTTDLTFTEASARYDAAIECCFDGGGNPITVGMADHIEAPFAGTIAAGTLVGAASDSLTIDVRKCTYAQYDAGATHPVSGDSIVGTSPLALTAAAKYQDTTLTGWTTSIAKGDIVQFIVTSGATSITKATASLRISRLNTTT